MDIYVFSSDAADFSTTGLCGALLPSEALCEMRAGQVPQITMTHPMDRFGAWKNLVPGNILSAPVRVRMTPEMRGSAYVTTVEQWKVADTATANQRGVFTKPTGGSRKGTLKAGESVIVVEKGASRYKIKHASVSGWVALSALTLETEGITLPDTATGMEQAVPPLLTKRQLFRILRVEKCAEEACVRVTAMHIAYDASRLLTTFSSATAVSGVSALGSVNKATDTVTGGIFGNLETLSGTDFGIRCYTDIADARIGAQWRDRNALDALLNPEDGFCALWNAQPVFDDHEIVLLREPGADRGVRIEHGKNLLGATLTVSEENTITAVKPIGTDKNGETLYLTDSATDPDNYVTSATGIARCGVVSEVLQCTDCTVGSGTGKVTKAVARARMREQAQNRFSVDKCDCAEIGLTVDFVSLGDTVEYARYKNLEKVFLYDYVTIAAGAYGIEATARVNSMVWDCLREKVQEIELGSVSSDRRVYSWQVRSVKGEKLENGTVSPQKLDETVAESLLLTGDAGLSVGTTQVSSSLGVKVAQTQGTYFQANDTKFGLYLTSDDSPVAEGGVEDGVGYFAANRLKDVSCADNGYIDLNAMPVGEGGGFEMRMMAPDYDGASSETEEPVGFAAGLSLGVRNLPSMDPEDPTKLINGFSAWIDPHGGLLETGRLKVESLETEDCAAFASGGTFPAGSCFTVTLAASDWVNNAQTVSLEGLCLKTDAVLLVSPTPASIATGVYLASFTEDDLTFACASIPAADVVMQVLALGGLEDVSWE